MSCLQLVSRNNYNFCRYFKVDIDDNLPPDSTFKYLVIYDTVIDYSFLRTVLGGLCTDNK